MKACVRFPLIALAALALVAIPARARGQDSLDSARQLYASADYRVALTMLDALLAANPAPQDRTSIELYRTFCLVALGNTEDATAAVEAMIRRDPLYRPDMSEVPPRMRNLFTDSRKRLLPSIIQQRYMLARSAFDRQDYKGATDGFVQVLMALADPDLGAQATQPPLADLGVLATNFNDLAVRAMAPPPAPKVEAPAPPPPVAPAPVRTNEIFSIDDTSVVPPVAVKQSLPPYPGRLSVPRTGVLEVVIDATGAVESATMVQPLDPAFNRIVLNAARGWVYQPARREGAPVKYRKRIEIAVSTDPGQ